MKVLITGGAGYIGSTIASALEESGHTPILLDSLVTGCRTFTKDRIFYEGDIADGEMIQKIFDAHGDIAGTIHCAALIVVPDSVSDPYNYYSENVSKSIELFKNLVQVGCKKIIFSSSAAIYGDSKDLIVTEKTALQPQSPYARTKYMMEMVLQDFCVAYDLRGIALRYFNPMGADPKMRTGMHVKNPASVIGKLLGVASGKEEVFKITGVDWPTRDGSGIRDYLHVWDLALAHIQALEQFDEAFKKSGETSYLAINLGKGDGVTVKELVSAFEKVYGSAIHKEEAPPREGDIAGAYANSDRAKEWMGWEATRSIETCISDALKWDALRSDILGY